MRACLVDQNGDVSQAVELAADWQTPSSPNYWTPPSGMIVVASDTAAIGWKYATGIFTAPPANTTAAVTWPPDKLTNLINLLVSKNVISQADANSLTPVIPSLSIS